MEAAKAARRRVSLSGMLDFLGVSRSGYQAFLKHRPSEAELRKERIKERIQEIYDGSHQNYGAPKITRELQKEGERISERTVGGYMREMGIRASASSPGLPQPLTPISARNCTTSWTNSSILTGPTPCGVLISPTYTPARGLPT